MKGFDISAMRQCPRHGHHAGRECPICFAQGTVEPSSLTYEEKRKKAANDKAHSKVPDAKPQRDDAAALGRAAEGKEESVEGDDRRTRVRFVGYRVRCTDPDNFAASIKNCLDFLHRSGIIEGDEPWKIILETEQVRVPSFKDEKTVIEVSLK